MKRDDTPDVRDLSLEETLFVSGGAPASAGTVPITCPPRQTVPMFQVETGDMTNASEPLFHLTSQLKNVDFSSSNGGGYGDDVSLTTWHRFDHRGNPALKSDEASPRAGGKIRRDSLQ